jgi:hypothetical protein
VSKGFVKTINGISTTNGAITLTKTDVGLTNVPNVNPVQTINSLNGTVTVAAGADIIVASSGSTITVGVNPNIEIDFSQITGDISSNTPLSVALAGVGVQTAPRTINTSTGNTLLQLSDTSAVWVNADFGNDTTLMLPNLNAPVGALIEVRQAGLGKLTIMPQSVETVISTPIGSWTTTNGAGTRIQIVHVGGNVWEFK